MKSDAYKTDKVFTELMTFIFHSEGGFADLVGDTGGKTMYGISWNNNADWLKTNLGFTGPNDIKKLTPEQAMWCYYERYWLPSGGPGIPDKDLAYIHFDDAVNCGPGHAKKTLKSLPKNPMNFEGGEGKNVLFFEDCVKLYMARRLRFYAVCKSWHEHLRGWCNRMANVLEDLVRIE